MCNDLDNEWFDVKGFEGLYLVNKKGEIYTNHYKRLLKFKLDKDGYYHCTLTKDGKPHYKRVHRVVAENFIPNPESKAQVNHINGIKNDNRLENLEWNTLEENIKHAWDSGLNENAREVASFVHGKKIHLIHKETGEFINFNSMKKASLFLGKKDFFLKDRMRYHTLEEISKSFQYHIIKGEYKENIK